jgi:hypothetical protein
MVTGLSKQMKTIPITIPSTIPNTNVGFSTPVVAESVLPIKNMFFWEVSYIIMRDYISFSFAHNPRFAR